MLPKRSYTSSWHFHVLAGLAVLAAEAWWATSTGVNAYVRVASGTLSGENPVFRLFLFPFLLTLIYAAFTRFRVAKPEAATTVGLSWENASWHGVSFLGFAILTIFITRAGNANHNSGILALLWVVLGSVTAFTALSAAFPASIVPRLNGRAALAVLTVIAASLIVYPLAQRFWNHDSDITVNAATSLLRLLGLHVWSEGKIISTASYSVLIAPACSGYEGVCLFLVFAGTWLTWFRKEYRFPAALVLLPVGALISWGLNAMRIAGFVLIGHLGHADIAAGGFHSRAGWIAFSLIALGFCSVSPRIPGIGAVSRQPATRAAESASDLILLYVLPFLAIEAASMLVAAASGSFEWLYPLRVLAPAAVFWRYHQAYAAMPWKPKLSTTATAAGVVAFALWILSASRFPADSGPWVHLAQVAPSWRFAWLFFRIVGGIIIAPVAEEFAFRGFLMRRIQAADFSSIEPKQCDWRAIALSSLAFGLMHGSRFAEGTAAGALYGYTYAKTGKLSSAILAHILTNLMLAVVVAGTGDWRYW